MRGITKTRTCIVGRLLINYPKYLLMLNKGNCSNFKRLLKELSSVVCVSLASLSIGTNTIVLTFMVTGIPLRDSELSTSNQLFLSATSHSYRVLAKESHNCLSLPSVRGLHVQTHASSTTGFPDTSSYVLVYDGLRKQVTFFLVCELEYSEAIPTTGDAAKCRKTDIYLAGCVGS